MRKNIFKTLVTFTGAVAMAGCLGSAPSGGGTDTPAVEDPSTPSTPSDPSGEATGKFNPPASTPVRSESSAVPRRKTISPSATIANT